MKRTREQKDGEVGEREGGERGPAHTPSGCGPLYSYWIPRSTQFSFFSPHSVFLLTVFLQL